jgi:ribosomal protein S27E
LSDFEYHADPQDVCPKCKSDNIADEGPPEDGQLHVTCHDCGYQWVEPEEGKGLPKAQYAWFWHKGVEVQLTIDWEILNRGYQIEGRSGP